MTQIAIFSDYQIMISVRGERLFYQVVDQIFQLFLTTQQRPKGRDSRFTCQAYQECTFLILPKKSQDPTNALCYFQKWLLINLLLLLV